MGISVQAPQTREEALQVMKELVQKAKERPERKDELFEAFEKWYQENKDKLTGAAKQDTPYTTDSAQPVDISALVQKSAKSFPEPEVVREFQKFNDYLVIKAALMGVHPTQLEEYQQFKKGEHPIAKALVQKAILTSTVTGAGLEWVPQQLSEDFIEEIRISEVVAKIFRQVDIPTGMGSVKLPAKTGSLNIYRYPESNEDERMAIKASTGVGTRAVTLTPKYYAARVPVEEQFTENVPFDVVAQLRDDLKQAAIDGKDNVIINGDTDVDSPMDQDLENPLDIRTVDDGLRKLCLSSAKVDAGANLASSHIFSALQSMGKYGSPQNVVIITSMKGWWELATLSELLAQVQYTEKPLVPAQIGALKIGVPVMISEQVRTDLDSNGVYSGEGNSQTILVFVNKKAWVVGNRKEATIEVTTEPLTGRKNIILKGAFTFEALYNTSSEPIVSIIYNV